MSEKAINQADCKNNTALILACKRNFENVALVLIPKMTIKKINLMNNTEDTALDYAIKNRMTKVIYMLISSIPNRQCGCLKKYNC